MSKGQCKAAATTKVADALGKLVDGFVYCTKDADHAGAHHSEVYPSVEFTAHVCPSLDVKKLAARIADRVEDQMAWPDDTLTERIAQLIREAIKGENESNHE